MMLPWQNELPPDGLHDELGALEMAGLFHCLHGISLEK